MLIFEKKIEPLKIILFCNIIEQNKRKAGLLLLRCLREDVHTIFTNNKKFAQYFQKVNKQREKKNKINRAVI